MLNDAIAQGARDRRVAIDEAMAAYRNAVMRLRAAVVRTLVDGEGMTVTAVAKLLRISRQMASRLYATAERGGGDPDRANFL
jgi:predicted transcriptional regulator